MLSESQRKFVEAVLHGASNTDAALAAGLSPATARNAGGRMRKHPKVVAALAAIGFSTPGAPLTIPDGISKPLEDDPIVDELPQTEDSQVFLMAVMNNPKAGVKARADAAKALLPYQHARVGEKGKKATKADAAAGLAEKGEPFAARKPPALKAV